MLNIYYFINNNYKQLICHVTINYCEYLHIMLLGKHKYLQRVSAIVQTLKGYKIEWCKLKQYNNM